MSFKNIIFYNYSFLRCNKNKTHILVSQPIAFLLYFNFLIVLWYFMLILRGYCVFLRRLSRPRLHFKVFVWIIYFLELIEPKIQYNTILTFFYYLKNILAAEVLFNLNVLCINFLFIKSENYARRPFSTTTRF